jgi:HEAT repeat protein
LARLCTLALVFVLAGGCEPTPEKISRWKETERGPRKLRDTVASSSIKVPLRGQALTALVELGMTQEVLADLAKLDDADRKQVIHDAVPRLGQLARGSAQDTAAGTTTRPMREAKDALFLLRDSAAPEDRELIDRELIAWTTADLAGRMSAGGNSSDKILTAIGPKAAPRLLELMVPGSPQLSPAAMILGRIADPDTRARAVEAMIRAGGGHVPTETFLQAIGLIGGPRATAFLVATAERGPEVTREKALQALAQGNLANDSTAAAAAVRIASDAFAPPKVREAAFQLAEKAGPQAVHGLVELMGDRDQTVVWRAVEAALAAGKAEAVKPVLEALNPARKYKAEDLDSFVIHDLVQLGPSALPALQEELKSKNAVARQVATKATAELSKR